MLVTTAIAATTVASVTAAAVMDSTPSNTTTKLMTATTQRQYGSADIAAIEEIARPEINDDEVLIEVVAAGLDRGVIHLMTGMPYLIRILGYGLLKPKNLVLGADVAGRVIEIGSKVTSFSPGDEVMGIAKGSFATYAAADETKLVHKPANVSFEAAAASTISGITALQALTKVGKVEAGERVLVVGASGGVGSFAVQIATALGALVTGVASGDKAELVRSLGAHAVIDYETTDLGDLDGEFDLIIDIGGRNALGKLRRVLAPAGRLVIVGGEDGGRLTGGMGRQISAVILSMFSKQKLGFFISEESSEFIDPLAGLLASGQVQPAIGSRYRLEDTPEALREMEAGKVSGKVVIEVE